MIATRYEARPKIGALVAYHAKGAIKRARYISPIGRPQPPEEAWRNRWYYNRVGKLGNGYVVGLTRAERALIRQGALVYMLAPSRGQKRLYIIDCSRNVGRTDAKGRVISYTWRYFARRPFIDEVQRLVALGAKLDAKTWAGFTKK
jgi:hypothetical protein